MKAMGKSLIKEDFDFNEMKSSEGYLGAFVGKVKVLINIQDIPLIVMNFSKCVHMLIDNVSSEKECEDYQRTHSCRYPAVHARLDCPLHGGK